MQVDVEVGRVGEVNNGGAELLRIEGIPDVDWHYSLWKMKDGKFKVCEVSKHGNGYNPRIIGEFDDLDKANIRFDSYTRDFVSCEICGERFKHIPNTHFQLHGLTTKDYKEQYPGVVLMCLDERIELSKKMLNNRLAKYDHTTEHNEKISQASKRLWKDSRYIRNCSEGNKRAKLRDWKKPGYAKKMMESWQVKPNSKERQLDSILQQNFPNEWKYTGDGGFVLEGLIPDFININGKKMAIELNGCYWHCCSECGFGETILPNGLSAEQVHSKDSDKNGIFSQYGFRLITIWEHDLNNISSLLEKLRV